MNHVDYPCKLNDKALELNVTWMDKWFRGELFGISGGRGLTLGETTKRLLQFYRGLENVVEEEAFDLGFVKKPKSEGTCLTIVAPELPTYQVAIMAARLIRNYQYQPNSDALNLQEILEKEKQDFWKGEEELLESSKVAYCSNFGNVTAYNWFFVAPIAGRLFKTQIDYRGRLMQMDKTKKFESLYSATDEWALWASLHMISHEMLSTLIGDAKVHETNYDEQITKRLNKRLDALLKMEGLT